MRDIKNATKSHRELWAEWSEGRVVNEWLPRNDPIPRYDLGLDVIETEILYGYRGLFLLYDRDMVIACLNTAHVQGKVSDKLREAIMEARGEGSVGE